jgi:hypothetical protein
VGGRPRDATPSGSEQKFAPSRTLAVDRARAGGAAIRRPIIARDVVLKSSLRATFAGPWALDCQSYRVHFVNAKTTLPSSPNVLTNDSPGLHHEVILARAGPRTSCVPMILVRSFSSYRTGCLEGQVFTAA